MTPTPELPPDLADLERRLAALRQAPEPSPTLRRRVLAAARAEIGRAPRVARRVALPAAAAAAAAALLVLNLGLLGGDGLRSATAGAAGAGAVAAHAAQIRALLPDLDSGEVRRHALALDAAGGLLPGWSVGAAARSGARLR